VYDAYPTGVAVSWAQHHGGPWPSTNSQHTSVGTTAIRRFLRPVTWQGAPQEVLPEEGPGSGKGEALWKSLHVLDGDIVIGLMPTMTRCALAPVLARALERAEFLNERRLLALDLSYGVPVSALM
jgi:hypothetical protein